VDHIDVNQPYNNYSIKALKDNSLVLKLVASDSTPLKLSLYAYSEFACDNHMITRFEVL
jgi:hypothetical protein